MFRIEILTSLKLQISLQVEGKALQTSPSCGLGRWNEKHTRKRSIVSMERVIKCIHHGNPTECGTRCWLFPVSCGYNKTKGTEIGVNVCDTARNRLKNIGFTCIKAKQKPSRTPKPKKTREAIREWGIGWKWYHSSIRIVCADDAGTCAI